MSVTLFSDLPDLVILNILHYLSSFDAIQAFYDIDDSPDRLINLLIEAQCFSCFHHLRLPLFHFVCDYVIPRIGRKLSHLTLYDHQLVLARRKQILSYLSNLSSLRLINISDIAEIDNDLSYFLHSQIVNLTIEFISEHHIEAQAYVCEQFVFHQHHSKHLLHCQLMNTYGLQLKHLNLFPNYSLVTLTIQLKELSDLHILFDHLIHIQILNIQICRWTIEDIQYDYTNLSHKLPYLIEFSLQTEHALSFNQMLIILKNLIHLEKLSFLYRNYDEHGIDIDQFEFTINHLPHLIQLEFIIKLIYFNLNSKSIFEKNIAFKQRWKIHTYINTLNKNYLAYTEPFHQRNYSISTDILLNDQMKSFPSVTNLSLTTHIKQVSFLPILHLLNRNFPSLTHLHIADSFGSVENEEWNLKLGKIHSFDATDIKMWNLFDRLIQSMPNLVHLQVNALVLIHSNHKLLTKNQIKHLEFIPNNFDQINDLLPHFPHLKQLTLNCKNYSTQSDRKFYHIILHWFELSSRLYTIHIKAHKLSDLFYSSRLPIDDTMHVQYSNELLTIWK